MITREYGGHKLACDVCGIAVEEEFDTFQDALDFARINRWRLEWRKGEWENICPTCREGGGERG